MYNILDGFCGFNAQRSSRSFTFGLSAAADAANAAVAAAAFARAAELEYRENSYSYSYSYSIIFYYTQIARPACRESLSTRAFTQLVNDYYMTCVLLRCTLLFFLYFGTAKVAAAAAPHFWRVVFFSPGSLPAAWEVAGGVRRSVFCVCVCCCCVARKVDCTHNLLRGFGRRCTSSSASSASSSSSCVVQYFVDAKPIKCVRGVLWRWRILI